MVLWSSAPRPLRLSFPQSFSGHSPSRSTVVLLACTFLNAICCAKIVIGVLHKLHPRIDQVPHLAVRVIRKATARFPDGNYYHCFFAPPLRYSYARAEMCEL